MIYEFKCPLCDYFDEVFLKVSERNNRRMCPNCHAFLQRLISKPLFNLKGENWTKKGIQ